MSQYIDDMALVLRRVDYGEADVIVDLLTQQGGRVGVFARSARKSTRRFTGGLGPFTRLAVRYKPGKESSLGTLQNAESVEFFDGIVEDPLRLAAGAWLVSLIESITQPGLGGDPFFTYVLTILRWLSATSSPQLIACGMLRAEIVLLQDAGVLAELDRCQRTGVALDAMQEAVFRPGVGLISSEARTTEDRGIILKKGSLDLLSAVLERRMVPDVSADALHPLREGLRENWAYLLDKLPRTWRTWDQAIRLEIRG